MAFQMFKKRGGGPSKGESTFETSEEKTEVPEIGEIMDQIDKSLNETRNIVVARDIVSIRPVVIVQRLRTMEQDNCTC